MKIKNKKILYFGIPVMVLIVVALIYVLGVVPFSVTSIDKAIPLAKFTHGEISCIPLQSSISDTKRLPITAPIDVSCQKTFKVTTDKCDIKLEAVKDQFFEKTIFYQICDISGNLYTSTNYVNCGNEESVTSNNIYDGSAGFIMDRQGSQYILRTNFPANKVLRITKIRLAGLPGTSFSTDSFAVFSVSQKYGIYIRDTLAGNGIQKTQNCLAIPEAVDDKLVIQATDGNEYNKLYDKQNYMFANDHIDYLSYPVLIPFSSSNLKLINGAYGLCEAKQSISTSAYYALEKVTTFDTIQYYYVNYNKILQDNVECCNGAVKLGYICVEEKWKSVSDKIPCSTTQPCPIKFETNYGTKQTYHQECGIDGYCANVITNRECTRDTDCLDEEGGYCTVDYICKYRNVGCDTSNDCLSGQICQSGMCVDDESNDYSLIFWIVIGLLVIGLLIAIFYKKSDNGGGF